MPKRAAGRRTGGGSVYGRVYEIVRRIPRGKVLTYGLISHLIGGRLTAQGVGWALRALGGRAGGARQDTDRTIPWQRVLNARGELSTHKNPDIPPGLQRRLLEAEGITFDGEGRIDLERYLWHEGLKPPGRRASAPGSSGRR